MKFLNLTLALTMICSANISSAIENNDIVEINKIKTQYNVDKVKLLEVIAINTIRAMQLNSEINMLVDYSNQNLIKNPESIMTQLVTLYPVQTDAVVASGLVALSYFLKSTVLMPALTAEQTTLLNTLVKRFPGITKHSAWVLSAAVTGATIYYTYDTVKRFRAYVDFKTKTADEINELLDAKLSERTECNNAIALASREILRINKVLDVRSADEVKKVLDLNPARDAAPLPSATDAAPATPADSNATIGSGTMKILPVLN
jgi:hypothetical protein